MEKLTTLFAVALVTTANAASAATIGIGAYQVPILIAGAEQQVVFHLEADEQPFGQFTLTGETDSGLLAAISGDFSPGYAEVSQAGLGAQVDAIFGPQVSWTSEVLTFSESITSLFDVAAGDYGPPPVTLDVAAVPLPAGGLLLLSGLVGMAAVNNRRKKT